MGGFRPCGLDEPAWSWLQRKRAAGWPVAEGRTESVEITKPSFSFTTKQGYYIAKLANIQRDRRATIAAPTDAFQRPAPPILPTRYGDSDARSRHHGCSTGGIVGSEHLMNHSFLHARLKQPRRLVGHNGVAEIRSLPFAAPVALKEVELRSVFHSYCNDSLL